jgi:hypothetical protein
MLNSASKNQAVANLQAAIREYEDEFACATRKSEELYQQRQITANQIIQACENYINQLANSPKEVDKSVAIFKAEYQRFTEFAENIEFEARKHEAISGATAGAGVAAGVGVAALGPSAAMAIATTFGTASTGTAISALSGAAATNAALAWLGGGALAAGGGGMVAGNALLALAGPIGWGIGAIAIAGGAMFANHQNAEAATQASQETVKVKHATTQLKLSEREIDELLMLTRQHADGVWRQLKSLTSTASQDYQQFTIDQKQVLAALKNNIESLSQLLHQKIA